eukprot:TRINITY_DN4039_c0_g1_i15.p1 TRINITY_DN4039_c0_g1~~TRINITY_DN4039_c0_g1_i15.p1  ORF type:complete len:146 (+),score=20.76 TRINITY_DN4039_c0_g1_i15:116-553(+)
MDEISKLEEKIMVAERLNDSLASRTNQNSTATDEGSEKTIHRPSTPPDDKELVNAWQKEMWRTGSPNFSIENHGNIRYLTTAELINWLETMGCSQETMQLVMNKDIDGNTMTEVLGSPRGASSWRHRKHKPKPTTQTDRSSSDQT